MPTKIPSARTRMSILISQSCFPISSITFFLAGTRKTRMDDASPKRIKVPHMGFLHKFPVRYLRTRTMMGQGYGATQTRIIRENNETMQYVCLTLCAPFLSISHPSCIQEHCEQRFSAATRPRFDHRTSSD